jgi:WD40 repeat protein
MRRLAVLLLLTLAASATSLTAQPPPKPVALPPINPGQAHLNQTFNGLDGPGLALAYDAGAGLLAAGCDQGTIHYWGKGEWDGVRAGERTPNVLSAHKGPVTALAWGAGALLTSAGTDQRILLWSMPKGDLLHTLPVSSTIRALAVTPDGKFLASGGDDGAVQLWELPTGKPGPKLTGPQDWVRCLAFSPDGKLLAAGGYDPVIQLWDLASGKKLRDLATRPAPAPNTPPSAPNTVLALAFSPDGKQVGVGGTDALIHLVSLTDGKIVRTLAGHGSSVTSLVFHPGGTLLISGSKDHTLRLWNPANGQPLKTLEGHTSWVEQVVLLAQGTRLASVAADQTVRLWDLN